MQTVWYTSLWPLQNCSHHRCSKSARWWYVCIWLLCACNQWARYTFDPTTPIDPTGRNFTKGNSTHGERVKVTLAYPSKVLEMVRHIWHEDGVLEMIVYNSLTPAELPTARLPSFDSGLDNKTRSFNQSTIMTSFRSFHVEQHERIHPQSAIQRRSEVCDLERRPIFPSPRSNHALDQGLRWIAQLLRETIPIYARGLYNQQ